MERAWTGYAENPAKWFGTKGVWCWQLEQGYIAPRVELQNQITTLNQITAYHAQMGVEVTIGGWATTFLLTERGGDENSGYVTSGVSERERGGDEIELGCGKRAITNLLDSTLAVLRSDVSF